MRVRTDPFVIIGIILAILLGAYNAWKEVRESQGRDAEKTEQSAPSVVPNAHSLLTRPDFFEQRIPFFLEGAGGSGGAGDSWAPAPPTIVGGTVLRADFISLGGGQGGESITTVSSVVLYGR